MACNCLIMLFPSSISLRTGHSKNGRSCKNPWLRARAGLLELPGNARGAEMYHQSWGIGAVYRRNKVAMARQQSLWAELGTSVEIGCGSCKFFPKLQTLASGPSACQRRTEVRKKNGPWVDWSEWSGCGFSLFFFAILLWLFSIITLLLLFFIFEMSFDPQATGIWLVMLRATLLSDLRGGGSASIILRWFCSAGEDRLLGGGRYVGRWRLWCFFCGELCSWSMFL